MVCAQNVGKGGIRRAVKITHIGLDRMRLPLDPPFFAAWDPVPRRHFDATLVRVHTDAGITGYGSGDTMDGFADYAELFIGQDPLQIASHVRRLDGIAFHAGRYWPLEAALWDIAGQACGQPVATLFGGALDQIACYASFGENRSPADRADAALAARQAGFRAVKLRIGREAASAGVDAVRAVRLAAGPELVIMVDLNQWWRMPGDIRAPADVAAVRRIADELRELDVCWIEEPLPAADLAGMRTLREQAGIRVAGGEMARTATELLTALESGALDVVQPDAVLAFGLSRARTVAEVALLSNRWFTPHTWTNGLGLLANLHVVAGVGGGPYLEFPYDPPGWTPERRDFFLAEPLMIDADGCLAVPRAPGLGAVIDESVVGRLRRESA
jgi:L-alanine-DL-glutamate epimerase-like enolase superfamily enzyme